MVLLVCCLVVAVLVVWCLQAGVGCGCGGVLLCAIGRSLVAGGIVVWWVLCASISGSIAVYTVPEPGE